ncbi:TldD/PmbA family protein [Aquisalinus flavus]|nr:TldD/PmbA family protein [Aquisalinus flavus]MBD0426928.1 TldD/PmbA family protein [Aquisalinus flavus]UNE46770.1 TldD/PmbA family protein [Aquisalinus flavus]
MTKISPEDALGLLIEDAMKAGADAADAMMYESVSNAVSVRLGEVEDVERSESRDLGLRVIYGKRQASVSTTDFTPQSLQETAERCVSMAKAAPEDPYCGLAPEDRLAKAPFADLDLFDGVEPSTEQLKERALACEEAARAVDGVTNSGGADAGFGSGTSWFATSHGFFGASAGGSHSVSVSVLAGEGLGMERDYDYDSATHLDSLRDAGSVGTKAGERAVKRLNPQRLSSRQAPVIFEQRLAKSLVGKLAAAINGASIARGVSFLKTRMGQQIFPETITIIDDPLIKRGFGSSHFDGEGVVNERLTVIDKGVLTTWMLNSSQARQLGLQTNGRATRGTGGPPGSGSTNMWMEPGTMSVDALIRDTGEGLYLTDMFGPQVNSNTGDYSVGCSGFWIEKGEIAFPVSEITIAGNLLEMFATLTPASDLEFKGAKNAPTLRIERMTIAGN